MISMMDIHCLTFPKLNPPEYSLSIWNQLAYLQKST